MCVVLGTRPSPRNLQAVLAVGELLLERAYFRVRGGPLTIEGACLVQQLVAQVVDLLVLHVELCGQACLCALGLLLALLRRTARRQSESKHSSRGDLVPNHLM